MRSDERAAIDAILQHWPLRSYKYKYGHWVYEERIPLWYWSVALLTDIAVTRKSWKRSYTTVAICDPATGAPLGVLDWRLSAGPGRRLLAAHDGEVEFAGDPYRFKHGAWVRRPRRRPSRRSGEHYEWVTSYDTPLHLSSRYGDIAGEVATPLDHSFTGWVLFAGDPRLIGVCRDPRDKKHRVWFTHSTDLTREDAVRLGLSLTASSPLPSSPEPHSSATRWIADYTAEDNSVDWQSTRSRRALGKINAAMAARVPDHTHVQWWDRSRRRTRVWDLVGNNSGSS
ncbi:hypothetical protein [Nocardia sp. NBC_00416]|uniref:hypothetical protein n=1 Tax=Nocardia sp. NBC_00416 TaxID=2975991 RepID=UPI002E224B1B